MTDNTTGFTADERKAMRERAKELKNKDDKIAAEADVMLKLGFKEDIEKILAKAREVCNKDLQIVLFSATIPSWIKDIAREHMKPNFKMIDLA